MARHELASGAKDSLAALLRRLRRHWRQAFTLLLLVAVSLTLVAYAYFDRRDVFRFGLALALGTNLVIVIANYVIFNPLIEQIRTATTREHPRLDYDSFIEYIAQSEHIVSILTTWSKLLEDPYRKRFLSALREALRRDVVVQILLLDPASTAAELRGEELRGREDVPQLIMANLRHLHRFFVDELSDRMRQQIQVRIYSASPSVLFYRWDSRAFLSFLPLKRMAEDVPKLETFVTTVWADFVRRRFEELWNDASTRTMERHFRLPLMLRNPAGAATEFEVNYVIHEGVYYVENPSLTQFVARHGIETLTAHVNEPQSESNTIPERRSLKMLDDLPSLKQSILESFKTKYANQESLLVVSLSEPAAQRAGRWPGSIRIARR